MKRSLAHRTQTLVIKESRFSSAMFAFTMPTITPMKASVASTRISHALTVTPNELLGLNAASAFEPASVHQTTVGGLVEIMFLIGIVAAFTITEQLFAIVTSINVTNGLGGGFLDPAVVAKSFADQHAAPTPASAFQPANWLAGTALPSFSELSDACHCVAVDTDQAWFLCAESVSHDCLPDETFSDYYGKPVFICAL